MATLTCMFLHLQPSGPQENCLRCGQGVPIAVLPLHLRECQRDSQSPQQSAGRNTSEDDDILPVFDLSGRDRSENDGMSDDDFQPFTRRWRHGQLDQHRQQDRSEEQNRPHCSTMPSNLSRDESGEPSRFQCTSMSSSQRVDTNQPGTSYSNESGSSSNSVGFIRL